MADFRPLLGTDRSTVPAVRFGQGGRAAFLRGISESRAPQGPALERCMPSPLGSRRWMLPSSISNPYSLGAQQLVVGSAGCMAPFGVSRGTGAPCTAPEEAPGAEQDFHRPAASWLLVSGSRGA